MLLISMFVHLIFFNVALTNQHHDFMTMERANILDQVSFIENSSLTLIRT